MQDEIKIGDRIKLEHIKSNSFIDSVVLDFSDNWIDIPGDVTIWLTDGWERVG